MGSRCVIDDRLWRLVLRLVTVLVACSSVFTFKSVAAAGCSRYPAIFCIGTSVSDTGNAAKNFLFNASIKSPYGETYFGHPAGRYCDGRLMIDFLAQSFGLPFLNPYLDYRMAAGTDFSTGINYAVAGATVLQPIDLLLRADVAFLSIDSLQVQLKWHLAIAKAAELPPGSPSPFPGITLPSPNAIANGLYFIEIGGNDYGSFYLSKFLLNVAQRNMSISSVEVIANVVPAVIKNMLDAIEVLYANNARNIIVLSVLPAGCDPLFLRYLVGELDEFGCLTALNEVGAAHNQNLLAGLEGLRNKYADINLMYADINGALLKVLRSPATYGESVHFHIPFYWLVKSQRNVYIMSTLFNLEGVKSKAHQCSSPSYSLLMEPFIYSIRFSDCQLRQGISFHLFPSGNCFQQFHLANRGNHSCILYP